MKIDFGKSEEFWSEKKHAKFFQERCAKSLPPKNWNGLCAQAKIGAADPEDPGLCPDCPWGATQ